MGQIEPSGLYTKGVDIHFPAILIMDVMGKKMKVLIAGFFQHPTFGPGQAKYPAARSMGRSYTV